MIANIKDAIYEILQNEADSMSNLTLVNNTRGMNGYPERTFYSIIDSSREMTKKELEEVKQQLEDMLQETIEQCTDKEIKEELKQKSVVYQRLYKENGWNLWEVRSDSEDVDPYDMYDVLSEGDNTIYTKDDFESEEDFIDIEIRDAGVLDGCDTFDDMEDTLVKMRAMWEAIDSLENDEILVRYNETANFYTEKRFVTKYEEDSHIYAIAFSII